MRLRSATGANQTRRPKITINDLPNEVLGSILDWPANFWRGDKDTLYQSSLVSRRWSALALPRLYLYLDLALPKSDGASDYSDRPEIMEEKVGMLATSSALGRYTTKCLATARTGEWTQNHQTVLDRCVGLKALDVFLECYPLTLYDSPALSDLDELSTMWNNDLEEIDESTYAVKPVRFRLKKLFISLCGQHIPLTIEVIRKAMEESPPPLSDIGFGYDGESYYLPYLTPLAPTLTTIHQLPLTVTKTWLQTSVEEFLRHTCSFLKLCTSLQHLTIEFIKGEGDEEAIPSLPLLVADHFSKIFDSLASPIKTLAIGFNVDTEEVMDLRALSVIMDAIQPAGKLEGLKEFRFELLPEEPEGWDEFVRFMHDNDVGWLEG